MLSAGFPSNSAIQLLGAQRSACSRVFIVSPMILTLHFPFLACCCFRILELKVLLSPNMETYQQIEGGTQNFLKTYMSIAKHYPNRSERLEITQHENSSLAKGISKPGKRGRRLRTKKVTTRRNDMRFLSAYCTLLLPPREIPLMSELGSHADEFSFVRTVFQNDGCSEEMLASLMIGRRIDESSSANTSSVSKQSRFKLLMSDHCIGHPIPRQFLKYNPNSGEAFIASELLLLNLRNLHTFVAAEDLRAFIYEHVTKGVWFAGTISVV